MFEFSPGKPLSLSETTCVPVLSLFRHRTVQNRTFINCQLSVKTCLSCAKEHPNVPSQSRESSHVSIPRSRCPCVLFYHSIHINSTTSGLADLGQICIQAALSGSPIHHCHINRNSSQNTFSRQSTQKSWFVQIGGQLWRPSKMYVIPNIGCHLRWLPQILPAVYSICKMEQ